ncbi:uncharacterized protein AB675_4081 [Cyphellophora attinorum]|uniref:Arf-GAP domain-containing protein n=1 Tax=Cyphellophora attinorum TaxID=1664694 RepID=A0A0N1NXR6_9EURO|nr:uncharacterized protein AB675_4081 [Phialophora attinorum]KPI34465.1 hypothetical protein AB675_4081 [Phialophora attinorum]
MSRRPAGNDRAAQNTQTLKALVKLEGNKVCADCKRNKHPRWASWNLGVFVCIRCSGIHRGMGTHISRVKSVDLDSWTDEQLQSILKWGNTRANKYWEAKLAQGHSPSEAKIENFIRTKYESKRWVMDGPMPDPSTLGADDEEPLSIVQEKTKLERSASQRTGQQPQSSARAPPPPRAAAPAVDLFGDISEPPARPSTADLPQSKPAARTAPPAAKPAPKQGDSLLGLDFFGAPPSAGAPRPASAASNPTAPASNPRGDLKNSILSLYSAAPKPQAASQPSHDRQPSFGGVSSAAPAKKDAFGGLADAFGGLNFSSTPSPTVKSPPVQSASSAFSGLSFPSAAPAKSTPSAAQVTSPPPLSGGNFFDSTPTSPPAPRPGPVPQANSSLNFSFTQNATPAAPPAPKPAPVPAAKPVSIPADMFGGDDFGGWSSAPTTQSAAPPAPVTAPKVASPSITKTSNDFSSAFNLSSQPTKTQPPAPKPAAVPTSNNAFSDPWGSLAAADSSPWGAPEPVPPKPAAPTVDLGKVPSRITPNDITGGWGAPISQAAKPTRQPSVTADEDFGGWTSASATQTPATSKPSGGGFGGGLEDNPWG